MYTVHKKSVKDRFNKKFVATYFLENCKYCMNVEATFRKKKYRYSFKLQTIFLSNALDKNISLNGASLKINGRKHSQI